MRSSVHDRFMNKLAFSRVTVKGMYIVHDTDRNDRAFLRDNLKRTNDIDR